MAVDKIVTIYTATFVDALNILKGMDITSQPHYYISINMTESLWIKGKAEVVIGRTMYVFRRVFKED